MAKPKKKKSLAEKIISKSSKGRSTRGRSSKARKSLKSFASKNRGKFQSPVHSNGFKQDVLIDLHEGGRNFTGNMFARFLTGNAARAAGKGYLKFNNVVYKLGKGTSRFGTEYTTFASDDKSGRVK
tara:strand:+ start:210 stop:587 length:378 start_codon:yes stop_codon:yes gene_type:complete